LILILQEKPAGPHEPESRDTAAHAAARALRAGSHLVTANKALLAERGGALQALADATGRKLLASAAVGAGRWPTAEAVIGDLLELAREVAGYDPALRLAETAGGGGLR
jgi:homoserine dehydrogenase